MTSPTLQGPFQLTKDGVAKAVTAKSPGIYVLGRSGNDTFYTAHFGRSDDDLAKRLKDQVTWPDPQFKFAYAASAQDAFEKECELFHALGGSQSPDHPASPSGSKWKCPCCSRDVHEAPGHVV